MKILSFLNCLSIILLTCINVSCVVTSNIQNTSVITAPDARLNQYKTYAWYQETPIADSDYSNGFSASLDERIRKAVGEELAKRGFKRVKNNPDVLVAYDMSVEVPIHKDKPELYLDGFGYSYGYMHGYRYNYTSNDMPGYRPVDLFKSGTLIIDLVSTNKNKLVWRGWKEGAIDPNKLSYKRVKQEVADVLAKLK